MKDLQHFKQHFAKVLLPQVTGKLKTFLVVKYKMKSVLFQLIVRLKQCVFQFNFCHGSG